MNIVIDISRTFKPYTPLVGVHVLPIVLSADFIASIRKDITIKAHHDDSGGHGSDGGHNSLGKAKPFKAEKPYNFPFIAELLYEAIPDIQLNNGLRSVSVDPNMQVYTLPDGGGIVPVHIDKNFSVGKQKALYSVLIYLNDAYEGGQTVFNMDTYAPEVPVGAGICFRHDIVHEGLQVTKGEKHVLKTDLLFV